MANPANPMKARGLVRKPGEWYRAELDLFGRIFTRSFTKQADMDEWVRDTNEHLDHEWKALLDAHGLIMEGFVAALREEGVDEEAIDKAMLKVRDNAEA